MFVFFLIKIFTRKNGNGMVSFKILGSRCVAMVFYIGDKKYSFTKEELQSMYVGEGDKLLFIDITRKFLKYIKSIAKNIV